jgi:dephospho-CoA kinase
MNKPLLLVITGRPASGKTTLAHILSKEIKCPLISRDELKEGYVNTLNAGHNQSHDLINRYIYEIFFETIDLLISKGASIIIEAAFQHRLWQPKLSDFLNKADVKIIVCETNTDLARARFTDRLLNNPDREKFHEDNLMLLRDEKMNSLIENYERVNIEVPILIVDTTNSYNPGIERIINFIKQKSDG